MSVKPYQDVVFPGGYSPFATKGDCWFDQRAADLAVGFSQKYFVHVKGPKGGEPFILEPWEEDIVSTLFGWKRPDGRRRYRMAYIEIPRGNGKSMLCVVIVGLLLFIDDEPGADVFSAAGTREQSKEVFEPFKVNVLRHSTLSRRTRCYVNSISHIDPGTGVVKGVYKAIAADADHQHGGSPHGVIFDELHVQPNRDLWDVLWTGAIKRRNALTAAITTAGFDKLSICYEQRQIADRVRSCRDGSYDGGDFLPVVYAADDSDDWKSPATWRKANPNIDVSILESDLAKECQRAIETPAYENTFKRLHLNVWTEQDVRWLPVDKWENAEIIDAESLVGQTCYAGLDLASARDLTALVLMFPHDDGTYSILPYFWVPEDAAAQRSRRDRVPYDVWVKQGWIKTTKDNATDYQKVRADIDELAQKYGIRKIAVDRLFQGEETCHRLSEMGFDVEAFGQGFFSMAAPTKRFDELYHAGKFKHDGNPVMRWMIGNASVEFDSAKNMKPSKKKSTEKIDGVVSACMALGLCMTNETDAGYWKPEDGVFL